MVAKQLSDRELIEALIRVVAVADRETDEFINARAVIAKAEEHGIAKDSTVKEWKRRDLISKLYCGWSDYAKSKPGGITARETIAWIVNALDAEGPFKLTKKEG